MRNNRNNEAFSRCLIVTFRYNHNDDAAMRKSTNFRLTRTTKQHNGEAGMRDDDLHRQRFQQRTVGLAVEGLKKGGLFVLKKTVGFALIKADCVALIKADCIVLIKTVFSPLKRRFGSL
jgi:hypothetical protein